MANVTEDGLQTMAKSIVGDFLKGGDLTTLVKEKVASVGFNKDQAARLVERTNSEAFLTVFPRQTEFKVADPKVVLASFEPSNSTKTASYHDTHVTYKRAMELGFDSVFGVTESEKLASVDEPRLSNRQNYIDRVYATKLDEAIRVEKTAKDLDLENASVTMWHMYKQATLNGTSTDKTEEDLLLTYPGNVREVCNLVTRFNEKLASDLTVPRKLIKRAGIETFNTKKVVSTTDITDQFGELIRLGTTY